MTGPLAVGVFVIGVFDSGRVCGSGTLNAVWSVLCSVWVSSYPKSVYPSNPDNLVNPSSPTIQLTLLFLLYSAY